MKKDIHPQYHPDCKVYYRGEHIMTVGATVPLLCRTTAMRPHIPQLGNRASLPWSSQ